MMNLSMKLDMNTVKNLSKKLGKSIGIVFVLLVGGFVIYTGYFLTNLLYTTGDTSALEKKQAESSEKKENN